MEANKATCPICNKTFPVSTINDHANACLGGETMKNKPKKRKSSENTDNNNPGGWGFLMSNKSGTRENAAKKIKTGTSTNDKNMSTGSVITIDDDVATVNKDINTDEQNDNGTLVTDVQRQAVSQPLSDKSQKLQSSSRDVSKDIDLSIPLAEQMRPQTFDNYVGQNKAVGKDKMLSKLLHGDTVPSMILWGPPGCGKTTLAKIVAGRCKGKCKFVKLSATNSGVNDVKEVIKNARNDFKMFKKRTVLFLDEIHRFNKLQQDSMLPHVEDGTITLIGATTENPSFQVNTALLSRCRVIVLEKLESTAVSMILLRALERLGYTVTEEDDGAEGNEKSIEKAAIEFLSIVCDGDARVALNGLQMAVQSHMTKMDQSETTTHSRVICVDDIKESLQRSHVAYDRTGDEHYNMISALHKSMRGGDASAALYWMARMMEGGEDPLYIARRLIEFASDDIGLADPQALMLAVSTFQATQFIGKPECQKPLAQCVVYLSRAPKSYEVQMAYGKAVAAIHEHQGPLPTVPLHLRNASTKLMKNLGYGKGYSYDPSAKLDFFPECMTGTNFFK